MRAHTARVRHAAPARTLGQRGTTISKGRQARAPLLARAAAQASTEARMHTLADGKNIEIIYQPSASSSNLPPLVMVHGSYHSAWCWQEKYLPFFAARGHDCYSLSLRAQGKSDKVDTKVAGTLASHTADLAHFIGSLPAPPVVVCHSFGGLILQKYILQQQNPPLAGAAFLASVPPSGNKQLVGRFLMRDPVLSFKVTWGFIAKSFARSKQACQELFFSPDIDSAELDRYQQKLAACSPTRLLDLNDMNASVPLPPPPASHPPVFVMGGLADTVVDREAVEELAAYYDVQPVLVPQMAHDIMLDTRWEGAAEKLDAWLKSLPPAKQ